MINKLINTLLYPNVEEYALGVYDALREGEMALSDFAELFAKLHRLSLCSYYEISNDEFGDFSYKMRYSDPSDLCDSGALFALICLQKSVEDHIAVKEDAFLTIANSTINMLEIRNKLMSVAETIGDEAELTTDWLDYLDEFISWEPGEKRDFRFELLDVMDQSNAAVVFGLCTEFEGVHNPEKLKKYQATYPEDFYSSGDIREYHAKYNHSTYCFIFLDRANINERKRVNTAQDKVKKAQSIKDLLLALAEEDVYLCAKIIFPYTTYKLLTDKSFHAELKRVLTEQEILNDDQSIPDELQDVFALAKEGNAAAQSELASRYLSGSILPKDDLRALFWLKLAAEGGDALAQTNYGVAMQDGLGGISQDYAQAIEWFRKAAAQGERVAQYNLGLAYKNGIGVEKDLKEMHKWLKLAAESGHIMAEVMLLNEEDG